MALRVASQKTALLLLNLVAAFATQPVARAGEEAYETTRNVTYAQRDDRPLQADVYRPTGKGPFPAVLCVHGGAWMGGDKTQLTNIARMLAKHSYVAVAISYRLAPRYKFPAQIEDCRDAVRWMRAGGRKFGIDPKRIAAWGYSAGGHLVALLGVTGEEDKAGKSTRLRAVVAVGAPCNFQDMPPDNQGMSFLLGDTRRRKPEAYRLASPIEFVSPDDPPTFFLHGQKDRVVKIDQPTAMAARLKASGVDAKMYVIPDAGHIRAYLDQTAAAEATKFLDKQLK